MSDTDPQYDVRLKLLSYAADLEGKYGLTGKPLEDAADEMEAKDATIERLRAALVDITEWHTPICYPGCPCSVAAAALTEGDSDDRQ